MDKVDYIIGTLSKAIGVVGGYVAGSNNMREYLLNRSRAQLFSTTMMPSAAAIIEAINILESTDEFTLKLWDNSKYFKKLLLDLGFDIGHSQTPITPVIIGDEAKTIKLSKLLLEKRGLCFHIVSFPTVPKGTGRLRLMPSSLHTHQQLKIAANKIFEASKELNII